MLGAFVELLTTDTRGPERLAEASGERVLRRLVMGDGDEGARELLAEALVPEPHRMSGVRPERPHARVAGLGPGHGECALVEVPLPPLAVDELADAHPLAVEDANEEAEGFVDLSAREELRLLLREEARVVLRPHDARKEAAAEGRRSDETERVDAEVHYAAHDLRDVPTRGARLDALRR